MANSLARSGCEEFAKEDLSLLQEWNAATIATSCVAPALFKVAEGESAREALFQYCDKWMNDNCFRESLMPELFMLISEVLASWQKTISGISHSMISSALQRTSSGRSGSRVCAVRQENLNFDIDVLAIVEVFGSS